MLKYPHCVSYDIKKQVQSLVYIRKQQRLITRCTSLQRQSSKSEDSSKEGRCCPFHRLIVIRVEKMIRIIVQGVADIDDEEKRVRESGGKEVSKLVK